MGLRITTWNVNGIRNPFGYQPWRDKRTYQAMFDVLEADIVVMQETKIQRKDLRDDMVLVPGWDVYFSLPKHKKGYSGVAIYTRNAVCAPIRAEEGITGILCPPNSSQSFFDLPSDQQIGGYPTIIQLANCPLDAAMLDSEGRCVILEFPAFVLIGVYSPANRDETRDDFRLGFLNALDARVRNLINDGKRVFLTGDLNIIRSELDTANSEEQLRKHGMTIDEYLSTPARRLLNQLLMDGKVLGERDEGREEPVLWDICRGFHPGRKGMFTCWETKINARPGNFGSRIDYVLCSLDWKEWFIDSNIQEGLIGSDHCPVYAIIKDTVNIDGVPVHIRDIVNPVGMFKDGHRIRPWSNKDILPTSAKLIPEFDRRRNIRDMFATKPSLTGGESSPNASKDETPDDSTESGKSRISTPPAMEGTFTINSNSLTSDKKNLKGVPQPESPLSNSPSSTNNHISPKFNGKRSAESFSSRTIKRSKSGGSSTTPITSNKVAPSKGQSTLRGFFKPKLLPVGGPTPISSEGDSQDSAGSLSFSSSILTSTSTPGESETGELPIASEITQSSKSKSPSRIFKMEDQEDVIDPIVAKESWSKLLSKRVVPRCEHNEPCVRQARKNEVRNGAVVPSSGAVTGRAMGRGTEPDCLAGLAIQSEEDL